MSVPRKSGVRRILLPPVQKGVVLLVLPAVAEAKLLWRSKLVNAGRAPPHNVGLSDRQSAFVRTPSVVLRGPTRQTPVDGPS